MARKPRDYRREYDDYQGTPEQIKRRAQRNAARAAAMKRGAVKKGDGKEVDHTDHSNRKGKLDNKKTRVVSKKANRSKQPKRDGSQD
jgi:hypothetical protein